VATVDGKAAPVGPLDRRFIGRLAASHALTLEFDEPLDGSGEPLLVADGWIEYPYSQTMFAAWQAGATYDPPTIEARGSDGLWRVVRRHIGYPAGMPRQMSVPLGPLPPGTAALRMTTNQEIYWDRLEVAFSEPCPEIRVHELPLVGADLRRCGFAHRPELPQRRPWYDYERRQPFWDTRHQAGSYTALGPVEPLVAKTDDALAIFGPGEEVHVEFDAALPALPAGWTRRFVLETDGWCKDMDLYTKDGHTLAPLPSSGKPAETREALHRQFNTRYRSGY
jgi:hypothetical protein